MRPSPLESMLPLMIFFSDMPSLFETSTLMVGVTFNMFPSSNSSGVGMVFLNNLLVMEAGNILNLWHKYRGYVCV